MKNKILIVILLVVFALNVKRKYSFPNITIARRDTIANKKTVDVRYENPVLIGGSSFGIFFQTLFKQNRFETMIKFTSEKSIERFGKGCILKYYQQEFKLDYKLGQLGSINRVGDTIYLIYNNAQIFGTSRKIVMPVIVEKDTCKLLLTQIPIEFSL